MDLELFALGHGFRSAFVSFHQIPLLIGTFYGIIISFILENIFGFYLDLDLLNIIYRLGLGFENLNGFGCGLGLKSILDLDMDL